MYLTGTSLLIKAHEREAAVRYIPEKRDNVYFFDYRLVITNNKYYQLIVEMVTNLIIR
jgi:signal peptidase I